MILVLLSWSRRYEPGGTTFFPFSALSQRERDDAARVALDARLVMTLIRLALNPVLIVLHQCSLVLHCATSMEASSSPSPYLSPVAGEA